MVETILRQSIDVQYRYFVHDLVSNDFLAEIPFSNVSYSRSLREAGSFSGDIPVIEDTSGLGLYDNTLPGKTSLYVTRNGVCVWGGIIWTRSYNVKDRVLSVEGSEFTSYLHKRVAWKTWSNSYETELSITAGVGKSVLPYGSFDFLAGMPVYLTWGLDTNRDLDGYYYVVASPAPTNDTFYFKKKNGVNLSSTDRVDGASTVTVRQDTYEYARDLLESLKVDFFDFSFSNSEIEPSAEFFQTILSVGRSSNVATIVLDAAHGLVLGQRISMSDIALDPNFNGRYVVTAATVNSFSYENTGSNITNTAISPIQASVSHAQRVSGLATLTTTTPHGFEANNIVTVSGVNGTLNGLYVISSVPTTLTFSYVTLSSTNIRFSPTGGGTVVVAPSAKFSTYGEFTGNSGLDIDYSTQDLSAQDPRVNPLFRGSELLYVGDILSEYSNVINGFEYRIDCTYDNAIKTFKKTFMFLPLIPPTLRAYLTSLLNNLNAVDYYIELPSSGNSVNDSRIVNSNGLLYVWNGVAWVYTGDIGVIPDGTTAPPAAYGADQLVFEHPGNILDVQLDETAEDAATRFWVQGVDDTGFSEASLPYAAESSLSYLADGWPLLDQVEKVDNVSDEGTLFIYAQQFLNDAKPPISNFQMSINGSALPSVGTFSPGDWCSVIIEDEFIKLRLASPLEPSSSGVLIRKILEFDVSVPDASSLPEEVSLTLISDGSIQKIGGVRS